MPPDRIELGFFVRPWLQFSLDEALAGIAATGARLVGYQPQSGRDEIGPAAPPAALERVRAMLRRLDLTLAVYRPRVGFGLPEADFRAAFEREFDVAAFFGTRVLLFGGPGRQDEYDRFFALMRLAGEGAARRGLTIALKPHGGLLGTAADCLAVVTRVGHPAVRVAYDPGNVLYYTGVDPLVGLPELAPHVAALCVKDSTGPEAEGGTVMVKPGRGRVDFARVFGALRDAGFGGPALVETLAEGSLADVNRQAAETMTFLGDLLGSAPAGANGASDAARASRPVGA